MRLRLLLFAFLSVFVFTNTQGQCLEVNSIFVNACVIGSGSTNCTQEGPNEMFTFTVGATDLYVNDITVNWPNNSFLGWCTSATTALKTDTLNGTINSTCGLLVEPLNDTLPANANVIVITSTDFCAYANSFQGLADTMYILYQCAGNTAGHFANNPSGTRTLTVLSGGPCVQIESVSYDGAVPNADGGTALFDAAGNVSYATLGCNAPVITISADWSFTDEICNDHGVVDLTTLLAGNATTGGTWTGPRVTGTNYDPSGYLGLDSISYYVVGSGSCTDTVDSTIVFNVVQAMTGSANLASCDSVFYNGTWYSTSTTFSDTIFGSGYACDSFTNFTVTINSEIIDSSYFASCDSFIFEGNTYFTDIILRDTVTGGGGGPTVIDTILQTGFEDSEGWMDHSSGNWTQVDANGTWTANGMYANQFNPNNGIRNVGLNDVGDYLEFPPVDNPQTLYYYDRLSSTPGSTNELTIEYFDGTNWQVIAADICTHTTYDLVTIDLSSISALTGVPIRIIRTMDNRSAYIDDVVIIGSTSSAGASCDSIIITNIEINNSVQNTVNATSCNVADTGTVNTTFVSNAGCDSIYTVITTLGASNTVVETETICDGDSAFLAGAFQTTAGSYYDTIPGGGTGPSVLDTFYTETFDGALTWTLNTPTGANGADNNFWVINNNEGGMPAGSCGAGGGNNSLHITSVFNPTGGAAYDAGGLCGLLFCPLTNQAASSGAISTIGRTNLNLEFDFISEGDALNDNASVLYSIDGGTTYLPLTASIKSGTCVGGQGLWTHYTSALPASTENIADLRVRINWTNNDDGAGSDPSVAINDVLITSMSPLVAGCDTIVETQLSFYPPAVVNPINLTACDSVVYNGTTYMANTNFTDTITSSNNCDSIYNQVTIVVNQSVSLNNPGNPFTICSANDSVQLPGGAFASTAGNYSFTFTGANGCDSTVITEVLTEICDCNINLGPDTSFCDGETLVLDAGAGYDTYTWQDNSGNQTFTVDTTGTYYCTVTYLDSSNNLVSNGDFEQGDTGFTTDYTPGTGGAFGLLTNPGTYAVNTNPSNVHNNFFSCTDHTSGTGNMMIVNGSNTPNTNVWCQNVTVSPNTDYLFSAWAMSLENTNSANVATLHFLIDGIQFGPNFSPSLTACDWQQFSTTWNSGASINIQICIESDVIAGNNDYGIDDIFFTPYCIATDSIDVAVNPIPTPNIGPDLTICMGTDTMIDATTTNASYLWQDGTTTTPTFTAANAGVYYVDVTVNGCTGRDSLTLTTTPVFNLTNNISICDGDSAFLEGAWQTTAGVYTDNFTTSSNCDSAIVTTLSVIVTQTINDTITVCEDELPVFINGNPETVPGTYTDTLQSALTCDSVINITVLEVNPLPVISLGTDTTVDAGIVVTISVIGANANDTYTWINDLGDSFTGTSIQANAFETSEYILTATTSFNCSEVDSLTVVINPLQQTLLQIPTAFSPNGDGINEEFRIANYEDFDSYVLRVYNRWGELIFDNEGYNVSWDGTYKDVAQNIGAYVYYINATPLNGSENMTRSGNVTLIK